MNKFVNLLLPLVIRLYYVRKIKELKKKSSFIGLGNPFDNGTNPRNK